MNIVSADIDTIIINLCELKLGNLVQVNSWFNKEVTGTTLYREYSIAYNKMFHVVCELGLGTYARYMIAPHHEITQAFLGSCKRGHLDIAQWLVQLAKNIDDINGTNMIGANIIAIDSFYGSAFEQSCLYGHLNVARWLINLSENTGNDKINIHAGGEYAFCRTCSHGHLDIAQWLIALGESGGYGKIDIHAECDSALRLSCENGQWAVVQWLIRLGENMNYGEFDVERIFDVQHIFEYTFKIYRDNGHIWFDQ